MYNAIMYNAMPPLSKFAVDPAAENSVVISYDCVTLCYDCYYFSVALYKE